jgi:phosphoglycolate phosphatase-like HAD superfamily hydrolase
MNLSKYSTLIFDCDGVLLNSNFKKSEAYRKAALDFGASPHQADQLVQYHIENTGISRYVKFEYFIKEILNDEFLESNFSSLVTLLNKHVLQILKDCEIAEGLFELREYTKNQNWMVMSGGDQNEVRQVLREKKIDHFFNWGIYGSPTSKIDIVENQLNNNLNFRPVIFFGDSKYDIEVAKKFNLDFVFVYEWTDFKLWKDEIDKSKIQFVKKISDLMV